MENQHAEAAIPDRLSPERLPLKIQEELIKRVISAWVESNGKNFRELIKDRPELLDDFRKDSKTTLISIEKLLRGEETIH